MAKSKGGNVKTITSDPKLEQFIEFAKKAGQSNDKLAKEWYRSLPRLKRNGTSNHELVKQFVK